LAAKCRSTGAARLPERSRRKDSSVPATAVPAATAETAAIRAPRDAASRWTASASAVGRMCQTPNTALATAFITVSSVGLLVGRVPGLLTAPTGGLWVAERLAWLPVFALMLSGLWLAFRRVER
jgi:hypothetical protein